MSLGDKVAWERLGDVDPPARLGVNVRSPFREDGKTGGFNISRCGKFFKDYGRWRGQGRCGELSGDRAGVHA